VVVAVLEEERHHHTLEEIGLEDFQTASMWHPRDDVMKLFLGEDGVEFDGELSRFPRLLPPPLLLPPAEASSSPVSASSGMLLKSRYL